MYELCGGPYSSHVEGAAGSEACLSPPKVACNSIGRRFNKARKRCNSNAVNSRFEIVTGELHAKLVASSAIRRLKRWGPGGLAERTPHATSEEGADRAAEPDHGGITGPRRIKSHVIPLGHFSSTAQNVAIPRMQSQGLGQPRGITCDIVGEPSPLPTQDEARRVILVRAHDTTSELAQYPPKWCTTEQQASTRHTPE